MRKAALKHMVHGWGEGRRKHLGFCGRSQPLPVAAKGGEKAISKAEIKPLQTGLSMGNVTDQSEQMDQRGELVTGSGTEI